MKYVWCLCSKFLSDNFTLTGGTCIESYKIPTNVEVDLTWTVIKPDMPDYYRFTDLVESGKAVVIDTIPNQPTVNVNQCNSFLNAYLSKNNFNISLPKTLSWGYLYLKVKEIGDTVSQPPIFLYFHVARESIYWNYPVSGYPELNKSLTTLEDGEYLFKLTDIPMIRFSSKNPMHLIGCSSLMKIHTN